MDIIGESSMCNQALFCPHDELYDDDIGESTAELYLTFSSLAHYIKRKNDLRDKSSIGRCHLDSWPYLGDVYDILNCM